MFQLLLVLLAAGCASVVSGNAVPAPGLAPRPITGDTVKQLLLDDTALSNIVGLPVSASPDAQPHFGGPEQLLELPSPASPADCLGPSSMMEKSVYESANVKTVARQVFTVGGDPGSLTTVVQGVVTLPTVAEATALFAKFTDQWKQCDGTTVTSQNTTTAYRDTINNVSVANSILSATVMTTSTAIDSPTLVLTSQGNRALGVRANAIVEVNYSFLGQGSGDANATAVAIARAIMDKISALS